MDRPVTGAKRRAYNSIEEISRRYSNGLIKACIFYEYSILENFYVKSISGESSRFSIPDFAVIDSEEKGANNGNTAGVFRVQK